MTYRGKTLSVGLSATVKLAALAAADGRLLDWTADANGVEGVFAQPCVAQPCIAQPG